MSRIAGKGHTKVLIAGLGWAGAELVFSRLLVLWVGARGTEFDWKFIQKSFEANISIVSNCCTYCFLGCIIGTIFVNRYTFYQLLPLFGCIRATISHVICFLPFLFSLDSIATNLLFAT